MYGSEQCLKLKAHHSVVSKVCYLTLYTMMKNRNFTSHLSEVFEFLGSDTRLAELGSKGGISDLAKTGIDAAKAGPSQKTHLALPWGLFGCLHMKRGWLSC